MELMAEMIGMKCFKGRVNGSDIDSGVIYSIVKMDERYNRKDQDGLNWKFGHNVEEWKTPNSEFIMRMSHLKPSIKNPVPVRIVIERVSNGRETSEVLIDVVPLNAATVDQNTGEIRQMPAPVQSAAPAQSQAPAPLRKAA